MFGWLWKFRIEEEDTSKMWSEGSLPENGVVDWSVGVHASRTTRIRDNVIPESGFGERLFSFQTRRPFSSCLVAFKLFFFWCISKSEICVDFRFYIFIWQHSGIFTCFTRSMFSFSQPVVRYTRALGIGSVSKNQQTPQVTTRTRIKYSNKIRTGSQLVSC